MDLDAAAADYRRARKGVEVAKRAAKRRVAAAREYEDAARETLHAAMVEAAQDGMRPVEIQRRTGYTPGADQADSPRRRCGAAGLTAGPSGYIASTGGFVTRP